MGELNFNYYMNVFINIHIFFSLNYKNKSLLFFIVYFKTFNISIQLNQLLLF